MAETAEIDSTGSAAAAAMNAFLTSSTVIAPESDTSRSARPVRIWSPIGDNKPIDSPSAAASSPKRPVVWICVSLWAKTSIPCTSANV